MKVKRSQAVAMLVALGFEKASTWDDGKLESKLNGVPDTVKEEDVPKGFEDLYKELCDTDDPIEFVGGDEAKEDKPAKKSKTDKVLDKIAKDKKKAAEKKGKKKPAEEEKDDAAEPDDDEEEEPPAKSKKAAKKAKSEKPEKEPIEKDEYGSRVGTIRAKINGALSTKWQTAEEIAEAAEVNLKQARSRLRRAARKGMVEVERSVKYRLAEK